jgi:hypothetical protein
MEAETRLQMMAGIHRLDHRLFLCAALLHALTAPLLSDDVLLQYYLCPFHSPYEQLFAIVQHYWRIFCSKIKV